MQSEIKRNKRIRKKSSVYNNKPTNRATFEKTFQKPIEEFDSIKRAVEGLREKTKCNYYVDLPAFFLFLQENPDAVIANRRTHLNSQNDEDLERYERRIKTFIQGMEEKDYAGSAIKGVLSRIMGFFSNNSKRYALDLKRLRISKARKIQKYSPNNEEIRYMLSLSDSAKDRLITLLIYHNGLAPIDISGLEVNSLPTEPWAYYERSRSKTGEVWRGVITPDIARELKSVLALQGIKALENSKKGHGEKQYLITGRQGHLDSHAISQIVKILIRKSGFDKKEGFKPTSLRDALEDSLVEANVNPKIKEAIMGHVNDIEHQYGGHNRLVVSIVEAMKKAYPYLATSSYKEETVRAKNDIEELKARIEESEIKVGRILEEKNLEIAMLKEKIQRIERLKPTFEALLKRIEEIEIKLRD